MRPKLTLGDSEFVQKVISEAFEILNKIGVFVENKEAYLLLLDKGAKPMDTPKDGSGRIALPRDLVEAAVKCAPKEVTLWDLPGTSPVLLYGDRTHFDPGSAALFLHDPASGKVRKPVAADLVRYVRLVDQLPAYHLQSTAMISGDVPGECADSFRLYIALKYGRKPVVTGTFRKESFAVMLEMLTLVRGGATALREKPAAIFDACPSPPLMWSDLTAQSVIDAAKAGLPSEFVSMPLTGSTSPVTLSGAIVQHTAETLSGVTLAQVASEGAPVIWGGSPAAMDLRYGTTPMGAIETMMIDIAYAAVGKELGLSTHAYMGLSDAKQPDYQAGMESALGILLAALAGINVVSGAGMLDFENCQSLEKLILDHEACRMAYRFLEGIEQRDEVMALDLLPALLKDGHLLTHPHTLRWFKEEIIAPGKAIDRRARGSEDLAELPTAEERATKEIEKILSQKSETYLDAAVLKELDRVMESEMKRVG
jgi:trimethylamine--corrinoid protein Co-methyltransferase